MTRNAKSSGTKNRGYRKPRTGDARKRLQPLWIDRLSDEVKDAIIDARATGKTWQQVEDIASQKAGKRVPHSTAQRWFDLRGPQYQRGRLLRSLSSIVELLESIAEAVRR